MTKTRTNSFSTDFYFYFPERMRMKLFENSSSILVSTIEDQYLPIFKWQGWPIWLFLIFLATCGVISVGGRIMVIYYMKKYAQKNRPINIMILYDQV